MAELVIVHFSAIESYPPVRNLLRELAKRNQKKRIIVLTTSPKGGLERFESGDDRIKIIRINEFNKKHNSLIRSWNYISFYGISLLLLLWYNPKGILYFETLSSFPVYVYKRFFKANTQVYIHYHEYTSPEEYRTGMILNRWFHDYEKWLYPRSSWVSHTNEYRMKLFKQDISPVTIPNGFILPNYPPRSWTSFGRNPLVNNPLRIVYIGALSMKMMYTKAFAEWVVWQNGNVIWHLYSSNYAEDAKAFLDGLESNWIELRPGIDYDRLPEVLNNYHVGVILYSGFILNHIFSVPNKLFEYLSCGLDVWFPSEIKGSLSYCTSGTHPKVMQLDFSLTAGWSLEELANKEGLTHKPLLFASEDVLGELINRLL